MKKYLGILVSLILSLLIVFGWPRVFSNAENIFIDNKNEKTKVNQSVLEYSNNENNYCTVTIVPSTVKEIGEYTLTITSNNSQDYYGSYIKKFYVINGNLSGSGTEPDPYIIDSEDDWICFASYVNNDNSEGKYFKLTDNISVSTMVGTPEHPFSGHFSGQIGNT